MQFDVVETGVRKWKEDNSRLNRVLKYTRMIRQLMSWTVDEHADLFGLSGPLYVFIAMGGDCCQFLEVRDVLSRKSVQEQL